MTQPSTALGLRMPPAHLLRGKIVRCGLYVLVLAIFIVPLWAMVATVFSGVPLKSGQIALLPLDFTFDNIATAWNFGVARGLFNSVVVVVVGLTLQMGVSSLAAYSLARKRFRGMSVVMVLILATMMMPEEVIAIPLYLVLGQIPMPTESGSLLNSYAGLILPLVGWALPIFVLTGFMRNIPLELEESARLDGAGDFRIFMQIVLPLCKPALGTCAVFGFLMIWDQFLLPLLVAQTPEMYTLTLIVRNLQASENLGEGVRLSAALILMVPGVIVYLFLQKYFEPQFMAPDIIQMQNQNFIATMIINGEKMPAFSGRTLMMPKSQDSHIPEIIDNARAHFTKPRQEVEDMIRRGAETIPLLKGQTPDPIATVSSKTMQHSDISVGGGILGATGVDYTAQTTQNSQTGQTEGSEEPKKKKRTRSRRKK